MSTQVIRGNAFRIIVVERAFSPASVAANTTAEQTLTLPGVLPTDLVIDFTKPAAQAGLGIVNYRVSAANTLAVTFANNTAGAIVPTAGELYRVVILRPELPLPSVVTP